MPRLTSKQRSDAIGMLRANVTVLQVANHINVSRICIWKLKTRFQTTGTVKDRPRSGRPRVTTVREDRHIRTTHLRDRFKSATETSQKMLIP